jgi:hypothetical protein
MNLFKDDYQIHECQYILIGHTVLAGYLLTLRKDLKGNGRGLIDIVYRYLIGKTDEDYEIAQSG